VAGVVSAVMLASGCTEEGTKTEGGPEEGRTGKATLAAGPDASQGSGGDDPVPAPAPTVEADPAKTPRTRDAATKLIREVIAGPELFGAEVGRATPYESDPDTWSVLGESCAWRREPLPARVLATLTRHFVRPAAEGKGPVRMTATVTVHPATADAAWEQAGMLEEALTCSEQNLGGGRKLSGLLSMASAWGEGGNNYAEDSLLELGTCTSAADGGPYPYIWQQATFGPVVVSVSACAGQGWDMQGLMKAVQGPAPRMLLRAEERIGRPAEGNGTKADPVENTPSHSTGGPDDSVARRAAGGAAGFRGTGADATARIAAGHRARTVPAPAAVPTEVV
jgi:hypothetical protein